MDKVGIPVRHCIPVYFASFHYMMGLPMVLMLFEVASPVFDILLVYFETRPFFCGNNCGFYIKIISFFVGSVIFHL